MAGVQQVLRLASQLVDEPTFGVELLPDVRDLFVRLFGFRFPSLSG